MSAADETSQHLEHLREAYVYKVNAALNRAAKTWPTSWPTTTSTR